MKMASRYRCLLFSRALTHTRNRPNRIRFLRVSSEPRPFDDKQTEIVALEIIFAAEARFPLFLDRFFSTTNPYIFLSNKLHLEFVSYRSPITRKLSRLRIIRVWPRVCPFNKLCNASFRFETSPNAWKIRMEMAERYRLHANT